jgi:hypothetical protein
MPTISMIDTFAHGTLNVYAATSGTSTFDRSVVRTPDPASLHLTPTGAAQYVELPHYSALTKPWFGCAFRVHNVTGQATL